MDFEITDDIKSEDREQIRGGLLEYNLARLEDKNPKELGLYYRERGTIKAGLTAETHGNWLEIQYLWVAEELRGKGIGSALLKKAEAIAAGRGCVYAFVDTFEFQAPKFYLKYGYREVLTLTKYPLIGRKHYYIKNL